MCNVASNGGIVGRFFLGGSPSVADVAIIVYVNQTNDSATV